MVAVVLSAICNGLMAHDFEVDGIYYNILSESKKEVEVTFKDSFDPNNPERIYRGTVNIPATVAYRGGTYKVIRIGENAFHYCNELEKVTLPTGLITIGEFAFCECEKLGDVTIPTTVTTISDRAFAGCKAMKHVVIPANVTQMGDYVFDHCEGVESVRLEDSATDLPSGYWGVSYDFPNVKTAYIGRNSGGWAATFDWTFSWYANGKLESVEFGPLVTEIPWHFMYTECFNVPSITIGANVKTISDGAFGGCASVKSVVIPDKVEYIGSDAFSGGFWQCEMSLREVIIGKKVKEIGENAFANCKKLEAVAVKNPTAYAIPENVFEPTTYIDATLYVPTGKKRSYETTNYWSTFHQIVEGNYELGIATMNADDNTAKDWITIGGTTLKGMPSERGIYINGGKKVMVK